MSPAALGPTRIACAAGVLLALLGVAHAEEPASYEFLLRQGRLQFEYKQFAEATQTLAQACATAEGARDAQCFTQLAAAAERAGEIGQALEAWDSAGRLGLPGAGPETKRLRSQWGAAVFVPPPGRDLPTWPGAMTFEGLLIDPALKEALAAIQGRVAADGLPAGERWLPAGDYALGDASWTVVAGEPVEVLLPTSSAPWRPQAFQLHSGPLAPLGGPGELGLGLRVLSGDTPGGGLGLVPIGGGLEVRLGRHAGPTRLELRVAAGLQPTRSTTDDDRGGFAVPITGQADLGLDLAPSSTLTLTPHVGFVGGSLGRMLVACRAENRAGTVVADGECRLPAAGVGGAAGLDFAVPIDARGRLQFRWGLQGEAGGGWLMAGTGDALKGDGHDLLAATPWRFGWIRGGVDVGASIRF